MIILINSYYSLFILSMKTEFYIRGDKLISRQAWEKIILGIKKSIEERGEDLSDKYKAREVLKQEIVRVVEQRLLLVEDEGLGLMFSGGVDSSLIAMIARKAGKDVVCYTVGFHEGASKEPEDVVWAVRTAKELGVRIKTRIFDLKEAEALIRRTVRILGAQLNNVVNVGVGAVELACIEMAKEDDVKYLFSGLGSEEVFAGYQRHMDAGNRQAECWRGLIGMYERDLLRDVRIATSGGISFLTPFLDKSLIAVAMRIPAELKIDKRGLKIILREAAEDLGLPVDVAWRKKRAAQYGSRLDKAISKLARKKGFMYKKDYLKSLE
ncbi:MAG TPA: hypothetical protein ENL16_01555 [Candidatus Woesearchaeota archaeon]|nr:hypothetical protein [Candidatus Woesearchaeota archaeon]